MNNAQSKLLLNSITLNKASTSLGNSGIDVDANSTIAALAVGHITPLSIAAGTSLDGAITVSAGSIKLNETGTLASALTMSGGTLDVDETSTLSGKLTQSGSITIDVLTDKTLTYSGAVGEIFNTIWDCKELLEEQLIDYIRTSVVHAGGITHLRRIADFASLFHVRTGCHGATDLSPICMGAALHFDLWVPNFGIQEYMRHSEETNAVFPHSYSFKNGYLYPGETAGHGVDIDEKDATNYQNIQKKKMISQT